jgi:two-component sensor histidine kinase
MTDNGYYNYSLLNQYNVITEIHKMMKYEISMIQALLEQNARQQQQILEELKKLNNKEPN